MAYDVFILLFEPHVFDPYSGPGEMYHHIGRGARIYIEKKYHHMLYCILCAAHHVFSFLSLA